MEDFEEEFKNAFEEELATLSPEKFKELLKTAAREIFELKHCLDSFTGIIRYLVKENYGGKMTFSSEFLKNKNFERVEVQVFENVTEIEIVKENVKMH